MTIEEAEKQYNEYLEGHIGNVNEALDLLNTLDIQYVKDNYDKLKTICQEHDASKYSDEEYIPYREHFYPINDDEKLRTEAFEQACRHHIKGNKHHWDYWLNENDELDIPDEDEYKLYCVERCCDWLAMANQHDEVSNKWYNENKDYIVMPDYGFELCDEIMSKVPEKCDLSFKGTRGELDESNLLDKLKPQIESDKDDIEAVEYYKEKILGGEHRPILIGSNNEVIDGNHTMIAYKELGIEPENVYLGTSQDFLNTAAEIIKNGSSKNPGLDAVYKMIEDGKAVLVEESVQDLRNKIVSLRSKEYLDGIDKKSKGNAGYYALKKIIDNIENEDKYREIKKEIDRVNKEQAKKDAWKNLPAEEIIKLGTEEEERKMNSLDESSSSRVYAYRSIGKSELIALLDGETIKGRYDNSTEEQNDSNRKDVVCFFKEPYKWHDSNHIFDIKCAFSESEVDLGSGDYWASKNLEKSKVWSGRRGNTEYKLDEIYVKEYSLDNVIEIDYDEIYSIYNKEYAKKFSDILKNKNIEQLKESFIVTKGAKGYLVEASMKQLKRKTLSEDPTRAKKSKNVQSKYIGISKYGVLNFETTSETYSGVKWYQEVHFPSFAGFMNIVEQGDEIEAEDVKKAMSSDNIKISCDDPSFLYWAWKYMAWKDVYGLEKETRAPKRNNTRLRGGLCKHLYSVIELLNEKRIIDLVTRDLNQFCKMKLGIKNDGYQDAEGMLSKDFKANQYDYNIEDILKTLLSKENFDKYMDGTPLEDLGLSDKEMADIDKAIKGMRDASQYELKSELEKQFAPVKRGRRIKRDDIKLQVGADNDNKGVE